MSFPDVLSVIAQCPAPSAGPSDEKLDYDDDTLRGEKITLSTLFSLHLHLIPVGSASFDGTLSSGFTIPPSRSAVGWPTVRSRHLGDWGSLKCLLTK